MNAAEWRNRGEVRQVLGRRLFVVDTEGGGPVLLLLHGYPTSSHDFHTVLDDLAAHYRVIAHDHLGFGLSEKPRDASYSLYEQADLALGLWRELGVRSAHLAAHDYGTSVATEILARWNEGTRPVDLRSLTLSNGSVHIELARLRPIQKLLRNPVLGPVVARLSSRRVFARNMRRLWHDPSLLSSEEIDTMWELLVRDGGKARLPRITQYLHERVRHWDRWVGALRRSPVPTHFLWATEDPVAGRDMAELHHAETPGSTLTLLEGVGHYPMLEAPDRWAEGLRRLLESSTPRPETGV